MLQMNYDIDFAGVLQWTLVCEMQPVIWDKVRRTGART